MEPTRKHELIDAKISRLTREIEYNQVELEFAKAKEDQAQIEKFNSRLQALQADVKLLNEMKRAGSKK